MIISFNRDKEGSSNSDFSIKKELSPSFRGRHFRRTQKSSRIFLSPKTTSTLNTCCLLTENFSLTEDNKHSKYMLPTYRDQTPILIQIKPLTPSLKIKFIQDYSRRLNQMIYYACSCNNYVGIVPIL